MPVIAVGTLINAEMLLSAAIEEPVSLRLRTLFIEADFTAPTLRMRECVVVVSDKHDTILSYVEYKQRSVP